MTADRVRNYEKVELNSSVLRWRRNVVSDGTLLSVDGRVFQARAAAAENARSPSVDRRVVGMTRVAVAADRRWLSTTRLLENFGSL